MYHITIQRVAGNAHLPASLLLRKWAKQTLKTAIDKEKAEVTIRVVSLKEMTELNFKYRKKIGPTNVLSFPAHIPEDINFEVAFLGDIVICAEVVNREASEQSKSREAHWAHMIVHGILHLLGFDHEVESDALKMETLEIKIMQALGFNNPYVIKN